MALAIVNFSAEIAVLLIVPEALVALAVISINYLIIYRKVKLLKNAEGWKFDSNVVIIDTSFREEGRDGSKMVISPKWFLLPLAITLVTIVCVIIKAINGDLNKFADSGLISTLIIILVQIFVNCIFFGAYKWTEKAKQSLNGGTVGEIRNQSRRIRYSLSAGYLLLSIYISSLIMLIAFSFCGIVSIKLLTNNLVNILLVMVLVIVMALIIASIAKESNELKEEEQIVNRDDDKYYKFGSMYYNKNDPALFVEKRTGIGMTLNFARPAAKVFAGIIAALIIFIAIFMLIYMPGMTRERQIDVTSNAISISGTWGLEIPKAQIAKINMESELPEVLMKTNGADIGQKLYGKHRLEGYNNSTLFIQDKSKPFIAIYLKDGRLILINYEDATRTKILFDEIVNTK